MRMPLPSSLNGKIREVRMSRNKFFATKKWMDHIWEVLAPVQHSGLWLVPFPKGRGKNKHWEMKFPWPPALFSAHPEKIKPVATIYYEELVTFMVDALNIVEDLHCLCKWQQEEIKRLKKNRTRK